MAVAAVHAIELVLQFALTTFSYFAICCVICS